MKQGSRMASPPQEMDIPALQPACKDGVGDPSYAKLIFKTGACLRALDPPNANGNEIII